MNFTVSCSVCGHVHDHTDESSVDLVARTCGDCGYCSRVASGWSHEQTTSGLLGGDIEES